MAQAAVESSNHHPLWSGFSFPFTRRLFPVQPMYGRMPFAFGHGPDPAEVVDHVQLSDGEFAFRSETICACGPNARASEACGDL